MSICRRGPGGVAVTEQIGIESAEIVVFAASGENEKVASALTYFIATGEPMAMVSRRFGVPRISLFNAAKKLRRIGKRYRKWRKRTIEANAL